MKQPLKIGIVVNKDCQLPAWEYEMLKQIQGSSFATINAFLISENQPPTNTSLLYRLFTKFENWWFGDAFDACKKINIEDKFINSFYKTEDTNSIKLLNLDLIFFSSISDPGSLSALYTNYGTWKIIFGKEVHKPAAPPAFREVMNHEPSIASCLAVQLPGCDESITVYNGSTITIPFSVKNSINSLAWKSSSFLPYRLKELYDLGADFFFEKYKRRSAPVIKDTPIYTSQGNFRMAVLFLRNCLFYLTYKFREKFTKKRFTILISNQPYEKAVTNFSAFKKLSLPPNTFRADPFLVKKDNRSFVFFEEFLYEKNKAHISIIELLKNESSTESEIILDKPYHLSYPFVFEWENNFYMIPETSAKKTVELYVCKQFPNQWEFAMNLMENISLIDATLHFENGKWWMFGCTQNHPFTSTNDQLLLFYSENLFSNNWIAHSQNPVATDISNCRPAGKIFSKDGKLFRPAQNNASRQYGYALKINHIEILNEKEYKETEVLEILPGVRNNLIAVHTINFTIDSVVIDGIIR